MHATVALGAVAGGLSGSFAAVAAWGARRSIARWAFVAAMALAALECAVAAIAAAADFADEALPWQGWRLAAMAGGALAWWLFSGTYARGDVERFLRQFQFVVGASVAAGVTLAFARHHIVEAVHPAGIDGWVVRVGWAGLAIDGATLVAAVASVMNLERTYRAAIGTMRWRIKFAVIGVGLLLVTRVYTTSEILLFRGFALRLQTADYGALIVAMPLIAWSFTRTGHIDLDVYPSGSALKSSFTLLIAGVYLLVVGLLAKAVTLLGGDAAFGLKAFIVLVALVVLAIAVQSDRLQLRLRRFVSQHFQRPLHDYRAVWRKFTDGTASRVERADLCRALAALVADAFQALSVRIWLLNDRRDCFTLAASTSQRGTAGDERIAADPILGWFETRREPIDFELVKDRWGLLLQGAHPSDFPNGGHRICVPLFGRGELLGIVTLGDRVSGTPYTTQDLELLTCIGDHAAASLLNVQLSQKLLQAKQLEAFQAMAAFFVHDLKNAASTLNLMLQNLPVHFDDPEFRADALRGIGKTVDHINRLIGRLTALRHELTIDPSDADLNEIVAQVLARFGSTQPPVVIPDMKPVPPIRCDRDQLQKVITNLVLNATEAVSRDGRVRVATGQENGWVVLTVDDNGCGMTEEFVSQSLFRPFQTTKKSGLGIGMFQSKMIVEAHGGRIAVASQPGTGTRFQVFLRAPAGAAQENAT